MNDFLNISNKHILVTGASSGIGRACALLLSEFGAKVTITGRNEEELGITNSLSSKNSSIITCDLNNSEHLDKLVDSCDNVDGIVHCAGIVKPMPVKFIQQKHIDNVLGLNLNSSILLTSKFLKAKKVNTNASLVYISSISSQFPYKGGALYVASKAGLEAFIRTTALEHSDLLRANLISPGLVKTKIFDETMEAAGSAEMEKYEKSYPLGFGEAEDVANTAAFLLSERSKWITGEIVKMDGGLTLGSK